jgi:opacity protein-like surface antigen
MKTINQQNLIAAALTCALASAAAAARADDTATTPAPATTTAPAMAPAADADGWNFAATLPLWAVAVNGNATIRGHQANVDVNNAELRDHLDCSVGLALQAQKGKFGLFGNFGYMKFSGGMPEPHGGQADASLKFLMANAGVSYQLARLGEQHPFILNATAGVRYWYAATELSYHDASDTLIVQGGNNYDVIDPVLGLRATQYLTTKLHLDVSGDGGGFDLNHSTDWTWSVAGMASYDFARWFTLSAGYQAVALDESTGSGTGKNGKKGVDLIFSGFAAALTFKF